MVPASPAGYSTAANNNATPFNIPQSQPQQIPVVVPPSPTLEVLPLPNPSADKGAGNTAISDALSSDLSAGEEIVIFEEQSQSPYSYWKWPLTFIRGEDWSNSAELGINGTDGNSESMSLLTGIVLNRKTKRDLNDFKITAQKTNTNGIETQNNALMYYNYEYFIGESAWSLFVKSGFEYDEFKAFDSRLFINSGLAYKFVRTKTLTTGTRFGLGTSREFGGPDDRWVPELLFGLDYDHQINPRNKIILKVDYFPDFTDFNNYRVISDASWEYLLNSNGNLSLKLSAVDRYDSTPNGRKPNDINYGVLLLYKF
jgi:putative salt-induced outer membrane protein YdiY